MMKIDCEVTGVRESGEYLEIELHGLPPKAADWRRNQEQGIRIPMSSSAAKAFYIGRKVCLTVSAK
jgi:hypothetical protein